MKARYLLSLVITLAPSYSFAAQAIDCDELARHITTKMEKLYPAVAIDNGTVIITHEASHVVADGPFGEKRQEYWSPCKQSWDSESEYLKKPTHSYGQLLADKLPTALQQLEKYEAALMRCSKSAPKSCSLAKEIIFEIQTKKMLNTKCTDLYTQSVKAHQERWAAKRLAAEEEANKRKAFDAYIDDSKR